MTYEETTPKQRTGHWIPVSERLPEESVHCLCCDKDGYMTIGRVLKWSKDWLFDDDEVYIDVIAWMPLPEPYKTEKDDDYPQKWREVCRLRKKELCEDAISRQGVLESIFDDDTEYTGSEICSMVRNLPPVTPSVTEFADKCRECGKVLGDMLARR